jgi:formylglycine-generating enzyme required for sulfatase activity
MGRLFVETDPQNARVRVLNIRPKFYQGMALKPGKYHVEVSASGYGLEKKWIEVTAGQDRHLKFRLIETEVAETTSPRGKIFVNAMGIKFVFIEPGTFMMGSPIGEPGRADDEEQHQVTLTQGFYLAVTEVTQGQWRRIMGGNPSYFADCGDDCPVETVSWDDCQEFIRRLNKSEKTDKYRLPTESEWEYACRAGSKTELYTGPMEVLGGNNAPALGKIAWYGGNSCAEYEGAVDCSGWPEKQEPCSRCGPHPVAGKMPNAWGLFDMLGNVWEWCQDWYEEKYPAGPVTNPSGPSTGDDRVCRGGSWDGYAAGCRAATRYSEEADYKDRLMGLRLAMTP